MKSIINSTYEELNLDDDKLANFYKNNVRRSIYGRVPELISKLASVYAWPIDKDGDTHDIAANQETIIDLLASTGIDVDHDLLMDIKESKGFNTFMSDKYEIMEGLEPAYDELENFYLAFAEEASLPILDYKLTEAAWEKAEAKASAKVQAENKAIQAELKRADALEAA